MIYINSNCEDCELEKTCTVDFLYDATAGSSSDYITIYQDGAAVDRLYSGTRKTLTLTFKKASPCAADLLAWFGVLNPATQGDDGFWYSPLGILRWYTSGGVHDLPLGSDGGLTENPDPPTPLENHAISAAEACSEETAP